MSESYHFLRTPAPTEEGAPWERSLDDDPKIALLAISVARQQAAGFKSKIDIRQFECPNCRAPGFNSGFGFVEFTCGAEVTDGHFDEPCDAALSPAPNAPTEAA